MQSFLKSIYFIIIILLYLNNSAYALNVVEGWYGGIMLGGSYSPSVKFRYVYPEYYLPVPGSAFVDTYDNVVATQTGKLTYDIFGNFGILAGYRFNGGYRAELELNYNYIPYQDLKINVLNQSGLAEVPIVVASNLIIINSPHHSTGIRMEGSASTGLVFINGFYELVPYDCDRNWVPYAGIGIGYGYFNNSAKLLDNEYDVDFGNASINTTSPVAQAIIGVSYFLDDFTAFGLDARYITSAKSVKYKTPKYQDIPIEYLIDNPELSIIRSYIPFNARMGIWTVNLTITGAFNCL